jgi:hypothetical protein
MNSLSSAIKKQSSKTLTDNGADAFSTSLSSNLDLFSNICRNTSVIPYFRKAYKEDRELSLRNALYILDCRAGQGERKLFSDIVHFLSKEAPDDACLLISHIGRLGYFKLLRQIASKKGVTDVVFSMCVNVLCKEVIAGNMLAYKYVPSENLKAKHGEFMWAIIDTLIANNEIELKNPDSQAVDNTVKLTLFRKYMAKRKSVEKLMSSGKWSDIDYSHVPSLAMNKYKSAFKKHDGARFSEYITSLKTGKDSKGNDVKTKVNASVLYPYDVFKNLAFDGYSRGWLDTRWSVDGDLDQDELSLMESQWSALPNYMTSANVLPMVDLSASMLDSSGVNGMNIMQIAAALALYISTKNTGAFRNQGISFSLAPVLFSLPEGASLVEKYNTILGNNCNLNTNIVRAFEELLDFSTSNKIPESDMPEYMIILSDMQFDAHIRGAYTYNETAHKKIVSMYKTHGYKAPVLVYWNLTPSDNSTPVQMHETGTVLVSGSSPTVVKNILSGNLEIVTPQDLMLDVLLSDRYNLV